MKSYTDIEQSHVLSRILPIESADMCYLKREVNNTFIETPIIKPIGSVEKSLPCWSFTALYNVLPTIDDEFEPQLHRSLDKYRCTYEGEEVSSGLWRVADNPVDACVEMIIKLHELKML